MESSTSGAGAGGTLAVTAGELVSISGAGSGLLSTASSTGNAGQITVSAPALAPVPTLALADGGTDIGCDIGSWKRREYFAEREQS